VAPPILSPWRPVWGGWAGRQDGAAKPRPGSDQPCAWRVKGAGQEVEASIASVLRPMLIRFGFASSGLGSRMVSTPSE
jgi:hypothetical protein